MKKLNMTPRAKKTLIATGFILICVGAVALIVTFGTGATPNSVAIEPSSSAKSVDVLVDDISAVPAVGGQSDAGAFVPSSGASQTTELTEISKPTSTPPKPVVEGAASTASDGKVTPPTSPALTDKTKKPTYTSKPTVTASSAPSKSTTSSSKGSGTTTSTSPSGGKPGYSYDPVFGWTKDTGGKTIVESGMHEGGSQVGIMD